ncbi:hypothetical protein K1719_026849 [Acacia pycnantha]|nr:hypothetical protein K1719_026849 [Acacia pycnantha]
MDSFIFILLLLLLSNRVISLTNHFNFPCFLAFLCESWFTYTWFVILSTKWTPARVITYLHSLPQRSAELPAVDLLVTTADPVLEPPIITANTVLSLLALDYPSQKLACYVSDDGCSPATLYALVEASRFAELWVPFCKKYNVQLRAPLRFFSDESTGANSQPSPEFTQDCLQMKEEYGNLRQKIEDVSRKSHHQIKILGEEYAVFSNTERRNHGPIIKVILESKEGQSDGLPHLVYISREKRPEQPHNYKAGAMNVLTRVSGLMSNAPYMLNVDCDMMVNNPKIVQHAMCIFMDPKGHKEVAFVQCFQQFFDGLKDDPFGNQWVAAFEYIIVGCAGLQGPYYCGTNCFHRRAVIYGLSPEDIKTGYQEKLSDKKLEKKFGSCKEFCNLAKFAHHVATCGYEYDTAWGNQVGWLYGSLSEDVLTGLILHRRGWKSECCTPEPIAFTGCAPGGSISTMIQQKRWASGLHVNLLGPQSPVLGFLFGKIQFRQLLAYMWMTNWALRSIPELCYALLPPYCIITKSTFLSKGPCVWILVSLFVVYNVYTLIEYRAIGQSTRAWWNNQRMRRITTTTAWFMGFVSAMVKLVGIYDTVFEITQKVPPSDSDSNNDLENLGMFSFDESPVFVVGTTILLIQLAALGMKLWSLLGGSLKDKSGNGEVFCCAYMVVCYWPFLKGLFGKGKHGIPSSTILKSATMALLFLLFCT